MLAKLLKYDMKSIARLWWPFAVSLLGMSLVGAFVLRFIITYITTGSMTLLIVLGFLFLIGCFVAMIASVSGTALLIYLRYYKHFFSDEGYLTFTLPVSRKSLLLSKTLNGLIWSVLEGAQLLACVLIFCLFAPPAEGTLINGIVLKALGRGIAMLWEHIGGWMILYGLLLILMLVMAQLFSLGLVQLCITIGAVIAKKAKLLAAIGIYYGVNMVLSFFSQIVVYFGSATVVDGLIQRLANASPEMIHGAILLVCLVLTAITASLAALMYCVTLGLLERKLNLA